MRPIKLRLIIESMRSRKDRSAGLSMSTPELTDEEFSELRNLQGIEVEGLLVPQESGPDVMEVKTELDQKSPSQRLRGIFFLLWKQNNENLEWEVYYKVKMDKLIEHFKDMLED